MKWMLSFLKMGSWLLQYLVAVYPIFKSYTMIPRFTYLLNLLVARKVKGLNGAVVECGVWRGGMIGGIAKILGPDREYFLFDSFEGLPPAKEIDGEAAKKWQEDKNGVYYFNNCKAEQKFAAEAMQKSGAVNFTIVPGWFEETLKEYKGGPIAILRLDADWYASTHLCLKLLSPYVMEGGIIIIDDYYTWEGCTKAVNQFLHESKRVMEGRQFLNHVFYIQIK